MAQKTLKQKTNNENIYFYEYRNDLLFFTYDSNHPKRIDIEEYYIGKLRLFRKVKIYSAEVKSKPYLNPSLIWNIETFQLMIKKLDDFVIEEEVIDFAEWLFVCVYIKIKGKQINLLKIKLTQQFGIDIQNQLWNQFKKYNLFKAKYLSQTIKAIQTLNNRIQNALTQLQKVQEVQIEKVEEMKKKLSALLYEKQKKIMQLTGNHMYKWVPQENQQNGSTKKSNQILQVNQANWMSSQDDRMLVGSLFAPSQDFLI